MTPKPGHELSFAPYAMSSDTRTRNAIVQLKEPQGTYMRPDHRAKVNAIGVEPMNDGCPTGYVTPSSLDAATDMKHRSYFASVLGSSLGQFRARVPMETMALDHRWLPRFASRYVLQACSPLLGWSRETDHVSAYDFSLPAALVDRWRPETHTFHLTVGEMAPTLQDVSYPLGLPLRGDAMGPTDVGQGRREDLPARFGRVQRSGTAPPYVEFAPTHTGGPPKWWILQLKVTIITTQMRPLLGATEYEIARHLEAYVLWLMGRVMFCSSAGSFVPKHLSRFARYVADAPPEAIPQFSRGSAVLAATYRGLCTGCLKSSGAEPIFGGCPLLRSSGLTRGSALVGPRFYTCHTRGTRWTTSTARQWALSWCDQRLSALTLKLNASQFAYAHVQTRKSYPDFVGRFDVLRDDEVRWEPYSREVRRQPRTRGPRHRRAYATQYRRTRSPPVFDIYVEEHARHRVLRRSGCSRRLSCLASLLPPHAHRFTRRGQSVGRLWIPRLAEFVARWTTALDDVVMEGHTTMLPGVTISGGTYLGHEFASYRRHRVTPTAPDVTDKLPYTARPGGVSSEGLLGRCRAVTTTLLSHRSRRCSVHPHRPHHQHVPAPAQTTPMTYPPPCTQYGTHAGPSTRPPPYYQDAFAAGTSSRPPPYYQDPFAAGSSRARPIDWGYAAGTTPEDSYGAAQAPPSPQGVAEQMAQSLFASPTQEELGYSQLHDAPPRATQQSEDQEAVHDSPPPRRTRQPRDPFSHGSRHTWAAQRAARRSKRGRS
ncbi:LOW QUALITY PROTEIN: hypothetical protein U9M48_041522 [Paspalum notatum var. saurae]|uniref:Aminotransferase-like plant mobile domain-containing protein n=1 Tax=Paspalum notatum var. saurae TaxID=547442 RepID=A0AAQ3UNY2_PASNO